MLYSPRYASCCCLSCCLSGAADAGKLGTKLYHSVNLVILAGLPAALATSPSALTMPLDTVMGLAMPLHAHIGMNYGRPPALKLQVTTVLLSVSDGFNLFLYIIYCSIAEPINRESSHRAVFEYYQVRYNINDNINTVLYLVHFYFYCI